VKDPDASRRSPYRRDIDADGSNMNKATNTATRLLCPISLIVVFLFRLALVWRNNSGHFYFYADSASHVMFDWLQDRGLYERVRSNLYWFPLVGALRSWIWHFFPDIFYGPIVLNALLGVGILSFLYTTVLTIAGPRTGLLGGLLFISVPSFCRLILSGQPETVYLFFVSASFCSICLLPEATGALLGLLAFWISSYARSEGIGFFAIYAAWLCWRNRERRIYVVAVMAITAAVLRARFPALVAHGYGAYYNNSRDSVYSIWQRIFYLPKSTFQEFDPTPLLIILPLWMYRRTFASKQRLSAIGLLAYGSLALLLFGSWFFLMAWESERNLCAPLLLLSACSAVALRDIYAELPKNSGLKASAAAVLAAALLVSWRSTLVPRHEFFSDPTLRARSIGLTLRQHLPYVPPGERRSGEVVLFENTDYWIDVAVFSGLGDSLQLINASSDPMSHSLQARNGARPWGMLVRTDMTRDRLEALYGAGRMVCPIQDYTLYAFEQH
jgi:hypothetical protein